jgi:hypothetical protein
MSIKKSHPRNKDTFLAKGTPDESSAAEIRAHLDLPITGHAPNTDQYLDFGGVNQISAEEAVNKLNSPHTLNITPLNVYVPFNTSIDDHGESCYTVQALHGGGTIDTVNKRVGDGSLIHSGADQKTFIGSVTNDDGAMYSSLVDDYTVSYWIRHTNVSGNQAHLVFGSYFTFNNQDKGNWSIGLVGAGGIKVGYHTDTEGIVEATIPGTSLTAGVWYHVAWVKKANIMSVYLDGSQVYYDEINTAHVPGIQRSLRFGYGQPLPQVTQLHGNLDEVILSRSNFYNANPNVGLTDTITPLEEVINSSCGDLRFIGLDNFGDTFNSVYSESDIQSLQDFDSSKFGTLIPQIGAGLKLYLPLDTDFNNTAPGGQPLFGLIGSPVNDAVTLQFGSGSMSSPTTSDYLRYPNHTDYNIAGSTIDNMTLSFWVKHKDVMASSTAGHGGAEGYFGKNANSSNGWGICRELTGSIIFEFEDTGNTVLNVTTAPSTLIDTAWHWVVLVRVDQSNWAIYLDGTQVGYTSDTTDIAHGGLFNIGRGRLDRGEFNFVGHMDDVVLAHSNLYGANPNVGLTDTLPVPVSAFTLPLTSGDELAVVTLDGNVERASTTAVPVLPRLTTSERDGIAVPIDGMFIYNVTTEDLQVRVGGSWLTATLT